MCCKSAKDDRLRCFGCASLGSGGAVISFLNLLGGLFIVGGGALVGPFAFAGILASIVSIGSGVLGLVAVYTSKTTNTKKGRRAARWLKVQAILYAVSVVGVIVVCVAGVSYLQNDPKPTAEEKTNGTILLACAAAAVSAYLIFYIVFTRYCMSIFYSIDKFRSKGLDIFCIYTQDQYDNAINHQAATNQQPPFIPPAFASGGYHQHQPPPPPPPPPQYQPGQYQPGFMPQQQPMYYYRYQQPNPAAPPGGIPPAVEYNYNNETRIIRPPPTGEQFASPYVIPTSGQVYQP